MPPYPLRFMHLTRNDRIIARRKVRIESNGGYTPGGNARGFARLRGPRKILRGGLALFARGCAWFARCRRRFGAIMKPTRKP